MQTKTTSYDWLPAARVKLRERLAELAAERQQPQAAPAPLQKVGHYVHPSEQPQAAQPAAAPGIGLDALRPMTFSDALRAAENTPIVKACERMGATTTAEKPGTAADPLAAAIARLNARGW